MSKTKKQKYQTVFNACVILRLIFAPIIFIFPVFTAIFVFVIDWIDGDFFKRSGRKHLQYSSIDKFLDYYWYIFILAYVLINNVPGKYVLLFLFIYRTSGQLLYFYTKKRRYLFYFPNVFELYFYFYLLTIYIPQWQSYMYFPKTILPLAVLTLLIALPREYILHIRNLHLSESLFHQKSRWKK